MKKMLLPFIIILCGSANAQDAVKNNGGLQVHPGASITTFGNFTNASSATLTNNGSLYIKGTLTNDEASMSAGSGTLYLNGSSAQSLNGSQPFKTYNLNTNNASGITLNNNLSVSNSHTFTAGNINTSATPNYLIYESGSSYNSSGDSKHVNGWVKKIGSANFIFPVGDATYERPVALNSLSGSSEFNVRYSTSTPNTSYSYMQLPLVMVNNNEYWTINKVSGGNATVTLNWDYNKVYFPNWIVADIVVAKYNGSLWTTQGVAGTATGTAATTGSITSSSIAAFNNLFAIGSTSWVLPLTLISFDAQLQNDHTLIKWITENEHNTDHFIIERSNDGNSFYPIGQLPAHNRNITEQYSTRDYVPVNNIAYYRLRIKDADGKETLSRIASVSKNNNGNLVLVNNPVRGNKISLMAEGQIAGEFRYKIAMTNGQQVQQGNFVIQNNQLIQLELKNHLNPGVYMLEVNSRTENFRYKIIVQ